MATYNILTIDGGGLRGIVPLRILQKVEELTGKRIQETFDMMAGTSTGGLIVSCLTLRQKDDPTKPQYSLEDIAEIYVKKGKVIFPLRSSIGKLISNVTRLVDPRFSPKGLESVLHEYLQGQRIMDSIRPILVATYDLNGNEPVFFKTRTATEENNANALIHDICRATSAAPTYLPAYSFEYKGKLLTGIDGGVYVNNPTMAALAEISKYGSKGFYKDKDGKPDIHFDNVRVLSLGTGSYTGRITEREAVSWGELQWASRISDIMMKGVNQTTDYEAVQMLNPEQYLRLNIQIKEKQYSDMADASEETRERLELEVLEQVTANSAVLEQMETFLGHIQ